MAIISASNELIDAFLVFKYDVPEIEDILEFIGVWLYNEYVFNKDSLLIHKCLIIQISSVSPIGPINYFIDSPSISNISQKIDNS